jgi:biotin operon repressor
MAKRKRIDTSIAAYHALDKDQVSRIKSLILVALKQIGRGTSEQIAAHLKMDREQIWKRCSDLKNDGKIYASDFKVLTKRNRFARQWVIVGTIIEQPNTVERIMPGKNVADYSRELVQQNLF